MQTMRDFIAQYPDYDILGELRIDYTDRIPDCAGLFPSGLVEVSRHADLLGNKWAENQYNFALYANLAKSPDEDEGATDNAAWLMGFQTWMQGQSMTGQAPVFGDDAKAESITAQNGEIYSIDDEGTALYVVQISVDFIRTF